MLINLFGKWVNPSHIVCVEEYKDKARIRFTDGTWYICNCSVDGLAERTNAQWPAINVEANTTNHY